MAPRRFLDEDGYVQFGKYKGDLIYDVADDNPRYLQWALDEIDLDPDEVNAIEEALANVGYEP